MEGRCAHTSSYSERLSFIYIINRSVLVKRVYRLRRPYQFQRVRREGRTVSHHLLLLNVAANRSTRTRCGFVVGKRIGKAVQRNHAKRRVREAVRLTFEHIVPGVDVVFVVRTAEVIDIPFTTLQTAIAQLLQRAGVWTDSTTES